MPTPSSSSATSTSVSSPVSFYTVLYCVSFLPIAARPPFHQARHHTPLPPSLIAYRAPPTPSSHIIPRRHMDRMTETKQHASPHCPCPHAAITPMTSSINRPLPRRMSTSRYAGTNRTPVPARRLDKTTRDTQTGASTERYPRGSESRKRKTASPSAATRNATLDETSRAPRRRNKHSIALPMMTTRRYG